ncbi:hypothetical protein [Rodentibacter genomosp. 2]|uniref:Uncharacterized protein n=1 Tax=Rodentibacter genomosp. 2 TaxID=1908266 RepID=A0A1V3JBB8_9PAST|nr:hypothetical protein [Rodentibacter genomosp. 2]OOF53321.1 hypothetical protein BKK55_11345 [Rodentibacter genomosp. 2]
MHKLLLMVTDAFMLEKGTLPYCYFDLSGGFIGSSVDAQWKINNLKNEFSDIEFEIKYYNASFCLIAHSKNTFINSSASPLPLGGIIKLNDNDLISLFSYKIRAKIFTNEAEVVTLQDELSYLLHKVTDKTISHLDYKNDSSLPHVSTENSILLTLDIEKLTLDPVLALKADENTHSELIDGIAHQTEVIDYKFFNLHIESGLEYYAPTEFFSSSNEAPINESVAKKNELPQYGTPSLRKNEMKQKQEEIILDPLFFIK